MRRILVSFFVWAYHRGKQHPSKVVELRLALKQLGVQNLTTFADGISGERFPVVRGKMTLSLPARDFRMLLWSG